MNFGPPCASHNISQRDFEFFPGVLDVRVSSPVVRNPSRQLLKGSQTLHEEICEGRTLIAAAESSPFAGSLP